MLNLYQAASCLPGGRVISGGVSFRAPGHGADDLSARILPHASMRNGYAVTSFAGDDPLMLRDYIDECCNFPRWEKHSRDHQPDPQEIARQERASEELRLAREAEAKVKAGLVQWIWRQAERDPRGTLVERYLNEHRKVNLPLDVCGHAVRFHPAGLRETTRVPMMLCAFRDIYTDEVVGLHRTWLDPETGAKVDRMMLGRAKGTAIKLSRDSAVMMGLHVAEGVESALAGMMLGMVPMWAMGSTGGIGALPVLSGIDCLTVCAETGEASGRAVQEVGARWTDAGRGVRVCRPRYGSDLNDAIKEASR